MSFYRYCGSLIVIFLCAVVLSFVAHSVVWGVGLWEPFQFENLIIYAIVWLAAAARMNTQNISTPIYTSMVILVISVAFIIGPFLREGRIVFFPHITQSWVFITSLETGSFRIEDINFQISAISALAVVIGMVAACVALSYSIFAMDGWVAQILPGKKKAKRVKAEWARHKDLKAHFFDKQIIVGEFTNAVKETPQFDPDKSSSWGRQGRGRLITLDPGRINGHALFFSGSGTFKTQGLVIPNALHYKDPIVVTDPKGEIYKRAAQTRMNWGRKVFKVTSNSGLDPFEVLRPLLAKNDDLPYQIAELIMAEDTNSGGNVQYFYKKSLRVLSALIGHAYQATNPKDMDGLSIPELLVNILALPQETFEKYVAKRIKAGTTKAITAPLHQLIGADKRDFASTMTMITNALRFAEYASTRGFIETPAGSDIVEKALAKDTDIFLEIPTETLKKHPQIPRLIFGALMLHVKLSPMREKTIIRRLFIIDEARALGRLSILEDVRDEGRAVGLHLMLIYQSFAQLVEAYGQQGARAWLNSVDCYGFGPVQDVQQATEICTLIGKDSVLKVSTSSGTSGALIFNPSTNVSTSKQTHEQALLTPDVLRLMPRHGLVLFLTDAKPILGSKALWFTRKEFKNAPSLQEPKNKLLTYTKAPETTSVTTVDTALRAKVETPAPENTKAAEGKATDAAKPQDSEPVLEESAEGAKPAPKDTMGHPRTKPVVEATTAPEGVRGDLDAEADPTPPSKVPPVAEKSAKPQEMADVSVDEPAEAVRVEADALPPPSKAQPAADGPTMSDDKVTGPVKQDKSQKSEYVSDGPDESAQPTPDDSTKLTKVDKAEVKEPELAPRNTKDAVDKYLDLFDHSRSPKEDQVSVLVKQDTTGTAASGSPQTAKAQPAERVEMQKPVELDFLAELTATMAEKSLAAALNAHAKTVKNGSPGFKFLQNHRQENCTYRFIYADFVPKSLKDSTTHILLEYDEKIMTVYDIADDGALNTKVKTYGLPL